MTAMVLRGAKSARVALGALTVAALAAAPAVALVRWVAAPGYVQVVEAPPGGAAGDRAQAYALGLLAKLRLPRGTRYAAWPAQPNRLPQAAFEPWTTYVVTAQALYRVDASEGPAYWFLIRNAPAGIRPRWSGDPGNGTDRYLLYVPAHRPPGIAQANLEVVIIPRGSGSLIRAEVQVIWYPPRSAAEYVNPGRYRSVTVTVPVASHGHRLRTVTRTFTSRAVIAELAALLNRLPGLLPSSSAGNCPAMSAQSPPSPYRLVFTPQSRRWPAIAAADPGGCSPGGVFTGKQKQPALDFDHDKIIPVMLSLMGQPAQ
jgi:hypothetical protein